MVVSTKSRESVKAFWQNFGINLEGRSGSQALKALGIDWEPKKESIRYQSGGLDLVSQQFKLLVNSKTGQDLAVCSPDWEPLGNREFYNLVKRTLGEYSTDIKAGAYMHGSRSSLRLGDRCVFLVSENVPDLGFNLFNDEKEVFSTNLLFYNHHNPGCGLGIKLITIRQICTNGMVGVNSHEHIKLKHTSVGVETYKQAGAILSQYQTAIAFRKSQLEALAEVKISHSEAVDHFIEFFGNKEESVNDQPIAVKVLESIYDGSASNALSDLGVNLAVTDATANSAYGVLQAVTAYYSHYHGGATNSDNMIKNRVFEQPGSSNAVMSSLARAYLPRSLQRIGDYQAVEQSV